MEQSDNSTANYQNNYAESINKHLKNIADQQKRQTAYLRNISAVLTLLLLTVLIFVLIFAAKVGILF